MAVICCHVLSKQGLLFRKMRRLWTGCECALSVRFSLLGRSVQSASPSFTVFNQKMCEVSIAPSPFQIRPPVILSLWTFRVQHAERSQQFGDTGCSMPWELVEWKLWNVRNVGRDSCALILLARCKSEEAEQTLAAGILADFYCTVDLEIWCYLLSEFTLRAGGWLIPALLSPSCSCESPALLLPIERHDSPFCVWHHLTIFDWRAGHNLKAVIPAA